MFCCSPDGVVVKYFTASLPYPLLRNIGHDPTKVLPIRRRGVKSGFTGS